METGRIELEDPSRDTFENRAEYIDFFDRLVKLEADSRIVDESWPVAENLTLRWSQDPQTGRMCAYFFTHELDWKPAHGQRCQLICRSAEWTGFAGVYKVPQSYGSEVCIQMDEDNIPETQTTGFSLYRVNSTTASKRMSLALVTFSSKVECSNLCNLIIGIGGNNDIMRLPEWHNFDSVPTLPTLSNEQGNIIQNVMQNHITLIEGFSGSGKTTCLLGIVHYLLKENQGRILVCAPTNQLVDHLALCIQKIEPSVVRFFPMIRHSNTRASSLCVEEKFRDYLPSEFRQLQEQVDRGENISDVDKQRLSKEKVMAKRAAWKNAKVICCTCLSAGNEQLNLMEFGAIIIDDSMQAVEPESIIPISLGCKRLVLVGDELQLKPIIQSEEAEEEGFKETLFERLSTRIQPLRLTKQFRMHPKLWNCIRVNYEDLHETDYGITEDERRLPYADWPNPKYPFKLINCKGSEARVASDEFRFINTTEAQHVAELARDLVKNYHIAPEKIGIITQFNDQAVRVMRKLTELGITGVEVDKMDHFLGREKDIIIVSCVRTSYNESFGSLKYKDRLHLTLTRAKCGLFIVADLRCLYHNSQNEVWRPVLNYYHQHVESLPFLG